MLIDGRKARVRTRTRKRSARSLDFKAYADGKTLTTHVTKDNVIFGLHERITDYPRKTLANSGLPRLLLDKGGPMLLQRSVRYWSASHYHHRTYPPGPWAEVTQGMYANPYDFSRYKPEFDQPLPADTSNMDYYAAKAWNVLLPTKRPWDFIQFLVEFRDTPHLWGAVLRRGNESLLASVGSEFLNHKFGWESLVKDLTEFVLAFKQLAKRYDFLVRNNGLPVRRKQRFYHDVTNSHKGYPKGSYLLAKTVTSMYPGFTTNSESRVDNTRTETSYAASGKFVYELPPIADDTDKLVAALDYALGVTLRWNSARQFHTLWKVWPWSWLLDWFGNLGTLIENASANQEDRVFALYAYCTFHQQVERTIAAFGPWGRGQFTEITTVIRREQATPYGFGINLDSLSNTRRAILLAAGATLFLGKK